MLKGVSVRGLMSKTSKKFPKIKIEIHENTK